MGEENKLKSQKKERSRQTFNINFYDLCTKQHNLSYSPALLYFLWVRVSRTHAHIHTHTTQSSDLTVSYSMNVKSTEFICTFLAEG